MASAAGLPFPTRRSSSRSTPPTSIRQLCSDAIESVSNPSQRQAESQSRRDELNRLYTRPRDRTRSRSPHRRSRSTSSSSTIRTQRSWTHNFVCLASSSQTRWITKESFHLCEAGLGIKGITFHNFEELSAADLKKKLEDVYPKLTKANGFDLYRLGPNNSRELEKIVPSKNGYTPKFLKRSAGTGKIFIKSIAIDLSLSPAHVTVLYH